MAIRDHGMNGVRYRGSIKHKRWRPGGGCGTLCPDWTHRTDGRGFSGDPHSHPWPRTKAHELFETGIEGGDGRRYATERGIAFVAVSSNDGTWHGFPVAWSEVPVHMQDRLVESGRVTRRQMRRYRAAGRHDVEWALNSDDE